MDAKSWVTLAEIQGHDASHAAVVHASRGLQVVRDSELHQRLQHNPARGVRPGQLLHFDCTQGRDAQEDARRDASRDVRLIQWNIERGVKLPEIISLLRAQDADVLALQELDIGCERSEWVNTAEAIAQALNMRCTFVTEFVELYSGPHLRTPLTQGGGVHGNAILSRYPHSHPRALMHDFQMFDWESRGHEKKEPRFGRRYTLVCTVHTHRGPLLLYSAHLEVFSGILGRLRAIAELFDDAREQYDRHPHQAILGDFNTLSHGIARLSGSYCNDSLRWRSLGYTEAEWLVKHVLTRGEDEPPQLDAYASVLPASVRAALANPGFVCPFDAYGASTLSNYAGWFNGKLDWMCLRNLTVSPGQGRTWLANHDFQASDHKMMGCDVTFDEPMAEAEAEAGEAATNGSAPELRSRHQGKSVAPDDAVAASATAPAPSSARRFAPKSSAQLRALMPLSRWRPGIVTSSHDRPLLFGAQIAAFCAVLLLAAAGVTQILQAESL